MPSERSRLELDPERMRELGYRTVDALVEWIADESQPLLRRAAPEEIAMKLSAATGRHDERRPPQGCARHGRTVVGSADITALVAGRIVREILTGIALRRAAPGKVGPGKVGPG